MLTKAGSRDVLSPRIIGLVQEHRGLLEAGWLSTLVQLTEELDLNWVCVVSTRVNDNVYPLEGVMRQDGRLLGHHRVRDRLAAVGHVEHDGNLAVPNRRVGHKKKEDFLVN